MIKFILSLIIVGIVAFSATFFSVNKFGYDKDTVPIPNLNTETAAPVEIEQEIVMGPPVKEIKDPVVLPTTKVEQIAVDQNGEVVSTNELNAYSVMGLTKEELEVLYESYDVVEFSDDKVVLEKNVTVEPQEVTYYLGIMDNEIGICLENGFQKLGLQAKDFSSYENTLLAHEVIAVSEVDKLKLEDNPFYIERLLQNLSE
ncbi:hypothetical protein [Candidatus Epulonipiscium viviparus]|uniref:hypothetical protein n=1 Tax=Candidatus Epulonipiscium viviparus TaxID=420336 RepID=UPI0027381357|nr:hypothetical protein [Candidatus Epulopiscium viviparus]